MERKFGIELEIAGIAQDLAINALSAAGINAKAEGYNHTTRRHWKLVSDSSVRGGFEVVSPVLEGEAGIAEAMAVAEALSDAGANVNRTCGFHVHFDISDLSLENVKTVVRRYCAHEAEIDAIMPPSRRGNSNQYCKGIPAERLAAMLNASSIQEMAMAQGSRYYKVNLQAFLRHGTIEFRQHSGTCSATKIANWLRFLAAFIDASKVAGTVTEPVAEMPEAVSQLRGVQARLAAMFTSQGTVSLAALCEPFGWLPHTGRAAVTRLRRAGLRIQAVRLEGQPAYRLEAGIAAARREAADSLWTGVETRVIEFYQRRAAVLAVVA